MDFQSMSDATLLNLLVGPGRAYRLAGRNLVDLFELSAQSGVQVRDRQLDRVPLKLLVAKELMTRALRAEIQEADVFDAPGSARNYLKLRYGNLEHEVFGVLYLDSHLRLIKVEELFRGTLNQTSVYPREIVKRCLMLNAAATIFFHNHPSMDCAPSASDERLTKRLKDALHMVDVRVLDHIIVGGHNSSSMAELGLM